MRTEREESRSEGSDLRARLATMSAERDAARRDVDREKAHGEQRVSDLRDRHQQQLRQLRDELAQVRAAAGGPRSRAARAQAQSDEHATDRPIPAPRTGSRRRGRAGEADQP